jgi:hypothetical protein
MRYLCAIAIGFAAISQATAADLAVQTERGPITVERKEAACLRWVPQNHSWYNYCDPIPYAPRLKYPVWTDLFGG